MRRHSKTVEPPPPNAEVTWNLDPESIRCDNPTEAFAVQAEFANSMAADYFADGGKIVELMGQMAKAISLHPESNRAHH